MQAHETAAILIVRDDKVFLIRRLCEPDMGWWSVPGGHVDEGENPEEAACREAAEEVRGVNVDTETLFVFDHPVPYDTHVPQKHKHRCHVFSGHAAGGIKTGSDAGEGRWFHIENALRRPVKITDYTRTILEWFLKERVR